MIIKYIEITQIQIDFFIRVVGIEPTVSAWKANRLPLTDTRFFEKDGIRTHGSIRTLV